MYSSALNRTLSSSSTHTERVRRTTETPILMSLSQAVHLSSDRTAKVQPRVKRPWNRILWLSLFLLPAIVIAVLQPWKSLTATAHAESLHSADVLKTVQIDRPTPAATAKVMLPATFRPWQTTTLSSRVSGYLAAWHSDLGARVTAGDVLAELETPELDQELASSKSLAREATAAVVQAKAERTEAISDLQAAQAQLVRAEAETELAVSQLARREKLLEKKVIAQEEYDIARKEKEARAADVAAAESDVTRRRSNLETRAAIIQVREATEKSRLSSVERLKELQAFKRIVAPFSGIVTRRTAEVGMLVTAGKESLFVIEDMSRIRVQMNVPQAYAAQVRSGSSVTIRIPESTAPEIAGTITRIAESVDATNRTMLAEIELRNEELRLQPGSYAQATLNTAQNTSNWTIPTNTLSMRVNGPHVAVVNDQNQIVLKAVTLGRDLGTRVIVADGIRGNERLVVNPGDDLVDGLPIQIKDPEAVRQVAAK